MESFYFLIAFVYHLVCFENALIKRKLKKEPSSRRRGLYFIKSLRAKSIKLISEYTNFEK